MEKLAEVVLEIEDGKIWELSAKKNIKFEKKLRKEIKSELRKEFEA